MQPPGFYKPEPAGNAPCCCGATRWLNTDSTEPERGQGVRPCQSWFMFFRDALKEGRSLHTVTLKGSDEQILGLMVSTDSSLIIIIIFFL